MSEKTTVFGIDLGTTYSCVSYLKDGHPTVCLSLEGENTTPSVVRMTPSDSEPVVGKVAKDTSLLYPDDTIQFVKSKIGKMESFEIGTPEYRREVTPIQISAEILKKLAEDASKYTNMICKDVVITVPAYFGNNERIATRQAGIDAGLNVVNIVEEPTAAAFYYLCEKEDTDATVCVYDLGGGTFDVTIIKKEGSDILIITTEGDHDLGGKNWDAELIEYVKNKFCEETQLDPDELDSDFLQELQIKCEAAKMQLTSSATASIALSFDRAHKANITVTREEFDAITATLLQTSIDLTETAITRAEEKGHKIDKILLVGGSSKMPQVEEAVRAAFGSRVGEILVNEPNESVAKGACIYCAYSFVRPSPVVGTEDTEVKREIDEETGETKITIGGTDGEDVRSIVLPALTALEDATIKSVATKSFGIRAIMNGAPIISNLIIRDTYLPVETTKEFGLNTDNMSNIALTLFQSDVYDENCELDYGVNIGESVITGLPAGLPAGYPVQIKITLNEEGIIEVTGSCDGKPLDGCLNTSYAEGIGKQ